jgi:hypothetical protein
MVSAKLYVAPIKPASCCCVQVAAKYQGSPGSSYATVDLRAEGSALVAALEGPSGRQPDTSLLLLDASKSMDPDDPQGSSGALTFSWGCTRQDFPALCFQGSYQVGPRAVALLAVPDLPLLLLATKAY